MVVGREDGRITTMLAFRSVNRRLLAEQVLDGQIQHTVHANHPRRFRTFSPVPDKILHLVDFTDVVARSHPRKPLYIQPGCFPAPMRVSRGGVEMSVLGPRDGERVAPLGRSSTRKPDLVSVSQRRLILSGGRIRVGDGAIQPSEAFDNRLLLSRLRTALWSSGRLHNDSKAGLFFLVGGGRAATGGAAATAGEAGPRPATNDFRSALRSHGRVDNLFSRILGLVRVAAPLSDVSKHIG